MLITQLTCWASLDCLQEAIMKQISDEWGIKLKTKNDHDGRFFYVQKSFN